MEEKFHCYECAGKAKEKGEICFTCDGEGNPKVIPKESSKSKKKVKKKK